MYMAIIAVAGCKTKNNKERKEKKNKYNKEGRVW